MLHKSHKILNLFFHMKSLLIGAPLANGSMQVESAGAIFKCNTERLSGCTQVHLDKRGEEVINGTKTEQKVGQWLGATLISSRSGFVLTCAPRYIHFSENVKRREPVGLCYLSTLTLHTDSFEYSPCREADQWGYHRKGSCQAGFAGAISKTGNSFFITAPGSWYWQGQVYSYSRNNTSYSPIFTQERSVVDDDTYLGYSIASCRFTEDQRDTMDIAISMPRGEKQRGKVLILDRNLNLITQIRGDAIGSYFGYALTCLDANGDGLSDLVISAPMFSSEELHRNPFDYDFGRVYIFYQLKISRFGKVDKLNGYQSKSRFGTSLANLGDLNKDGYEDLAIGAPWDSETGAVYIFNGSPNGISSQPSQMIKPEYIPQGIGIRTFGWSLAGGTDLNNDDYPDLLIGAYESDAAVFFKSRAIIDTKVRFDFTPSNISLLTQECAKIDGTQVSCITIDVCLAYNGPRAVPNRLKFLWFVTLDVFNNRTKPRMYVVNRENDNLNVNKGILALEKGNYGQCNKFKAYVSDYVMDKLSPIVIELQYHVQNYYNLPINSRMHTPMLNRLRSNKLYKPIHIMQNCGKDNVCVPDLKILVMKNLESYTLNGGENLILHIQVINNGEDAYSSVLQVDLPEDIHLVKIHQKEEDFQITWQEFKVEHSGKNKLNFYLGNPLAGGGTESNFSIELSGKNSIISSLNSDFTFIFNVTSANEERANTLMDNILVIGIPLRVNITLEPFGQSFVNGKPVPYVYNLTEFNEQVKQNRKSENFFYPDQEPIIRHSYYLRNKGPSAIKELNVTIFWPERTIDGRYLFELIDQPNIRIINQYDRMDMNLVKNKKNDNKPPIQVECERLQLAATSFLSTVEHHQILEQEKFEQEKVDMFEIEDDSRYIVNQENVNYFQNYQAHKRVKRKYVLQEPAQAIFTMDCDLNQCRRIQCTVREMIENTEVIFEILSRPWNQTLRHISISKFPVTSVLIARITSSNLEFDPDLTLPITINVTTMVNLVGGHLDVIVPLKSLVTAVFAGASLLGLLVLILIKLDFFKRELTIENYERKLIENSTTSNSLVDQQNYKTELLDRHLGSGQLDATTNYLQKSRLLRKRNIMSSVVKNKVDGQNRIRRKTIHHEYHNELTSSGGELQSSTYEEYRHLEEIEDASSESEEESEIDEQTDSNEENDDEESDEESSSEKDEETTTNGEDESNTYQEDENTDDENNDQTDLSESLENEQSDIIYQRRKINRTTRRVIYEPRIDEFKSMNNVSKNLDKNSSKNRSDYIDRFSSIDRHKLPTNKYNEKLYDKLHYRKNQKYYTFYNDEKKHEKTCPLYSSRRSLVSYR